MPLRPLPHRTLEPVDRQGLEVGDRVQVLANEVRMPVQTVGTVVAFSTGSGHPIVEIPGRGRFLIPARSLQVLPPRTGAASH